MNGQGLGGPAGELLQHLLGNLRHERLGNLGEEVRADGVDDFLRGFAAAAAAGFGHGVHDRAHHLAHRQRPERQVRVGVQAEDLGRFRQGKRLDVGPEVSHVGRVRHPVPREELDTLGQRVLVEVLPRVRVHEKLVEPVGDPPAVLDRRDHVRHGGPRRGVELLHVHLRDVVLEKLDARSEIGGVELVLDVPPDGAKLTPLLDDGVEIAHGEQKLAPLVPRHGVHHVLRDPGVGVPETGAHADGRLVGELDGHLE